MSKPITRPSQYRHVKVAMQDIDSMLEQPAHAQELEQLYEQAFNNLEQGKIVQAKVIRANSDGVLVDVGFKSYGLIPAYEFSRHEREKINEGQELEIILEELENVDGQLSVSYEKAKAQRAWTVIMKLYEEGKPVEGVVTHKVKGGLSVDIGIPAFLPGSQVDLQRVNDFDQFVSKSITAYIIKVNQKRGNVIISRRKYLHELRSESRKKILEQLKQGEVIEGLVKNITNYGVFIDVGGVDGLLHITDMTWGRIAHPGELVKIGDKVKVKILSFDKEHEKISLGMKQLTENPWEKATQGLEVGSRVKGKISSVADYGFFVEIEKGVEGLVHISEISWTDRIDDIRKHFSAGDEIEAVIVSLDRDTRRMSLSLKQLQENPWKQLQERFKVGDKVRGKVSNVTDFGVFIQLMPGIDGLVHISDLSWTEHISHPSAMFKKGDEVEAIILGIEEESKRVSLGIKQLENDPWENIEKLYPVGSTIEGEVSKLTNFGAFVKLPSGIEGLVHISELSNENVDKVEDIIKPGEKAEFKVLKINKGERKVGLSLKSDQQQRSVEPKKESRSKQQHHSKKYDEGTVKPKSLLQLELERHAARQRNDSDE